MSYAKQLKKQKKKKQREKKAKQLTTKVQNTTRNPYKQLNKIEDKLVKLKDRDINKQLGNLTFDMYIEHFKNGYKKQLVEVDGRTYVDSVESYINEDIATNNINIFNKFVYDGFLNIDMIKNSVSSSGMDSLETLLTEIFDTIEAFMFIPHAVQINKEVGREDINELYAKTINQDSTTLNLTKDNVGEWIESKASQIPEIYKHGLALKPTNEHDLKKLNDKFAELTYSAEENELIKLQAEHERAKYKLALLEFKEAMTEKFPSYINTFREKYITNNYDLKFDLYSSENTKEEKEGFISDMYNFFYANIMSEEFSTEMKYKYYHTGNRNLFDEVGAELRINTEELIQDCEYNLKHEIKQYLVPYGQLSQVYKKYKLVDQITWEYLQGEGRLATEDRQSLEEKFEDPLYVEKVYNAIKSDLYRRKEFEHKVSFEDVLNNEISKEISSCMFGFEYHYNYSILEDPKFELNVKQDFTEVAKNIVKNVKEKEIRRNKKVQTFSQPFEKEGFEELLTKKVLAKLESYQPTFNRSVEHYRDLINRNIGVVDRVSEFLRYRSLKEHASWKEESLKNPFEPDYIDAKGVKSDYKKILELLDIKSDSEVFEDLDYIISENIKAIESYDKQNK